MVCSYCLIVLCGYCRLAFANSVLSHFIAIEAFLLEERKKSWCCFVPLILRYLVEIAI